MLDLATAVRFDRRWDTGRTNPCLITCKLIDDTEVELIVKFSAKCDIGVKGLIAESIAAMLAADLDLPIPEPYLVSIKPAFTTSIPDAVITGLVTRSSPIAFGSKKLPPGYNVLPIGKPLPRNLLPTCAEIFAFDALIINFDRRPINPNCLFNGESVAIFDHESTLFPDSVLFWKPPWQNGSLIEYRQPDRHIFTGQLLGKPLDFSRFINAWNNLSDQRLAEYQVALPSEWNHEREFIQQTLAYIKEVRNNIDPAVQEILRVLS